jgi:hypothetical protein
MAVKQRIDDQDLEREIIALQTQLGDITQGVAVADAAGASPTAAEFKALLDSLRDA